MKINAFERNKGKKIQENYNWQFQDKMLTMMMWLFLWSNEIDQSLIKLKLCSKYKVCSYQQLLDFLSTGKG